MHVWRVDLEIAARRRHELVALLTAGERDRAARLLDPLAGDRFALARGVMRELLGSYLGVSGDAVALEYGEKGKPRLANGYGLHFNLSHAHGLALLACSDRAVGVDVERIRELATAERIARRTFTAEELQSWLSLPPEERPAGFFRRWTRMEAAAKMGGAGVWRLLAARAEARAPTAHYIDLEVPPGYLASLAADTTDLRIRVRDYGWTG